jgi:hypothetical protein
MAEAQIDINCLAKYGAANEIINWQIKRLLFYILANFDFFHDFGKARSTENEENSLSSKDIPDRVQFAKNLLAQMDPSKYKNDITLFEYFFKLLEDEFPNKQYKTFENKVFGMFSRTVANPLFSENSLLKQYFANVYTLPEDKVNQCLNLDISYFKSAAAHPIDASYIQITIPAVVYNASTIKNFVDFLHSVYSDYFESENPAAAAAAAVPNRPLIFVEDAASFPRSLFTNHSDQNNRFKKIVTTQTKWDPAGLSSFSPNSSAKNQNIAAPSFQRTLRYDASGGLFNTENNHFNQVDNTLTDNETVFDVSKKVGPSVNHLFMHMVLESTNASESLKNKVRANLKKTKIDKKTNLKLPVAPAAKNANEMADRLRKYATYKMSGDYENIHSAINVKAVSFTGDEPAFSYGVMNKHPMIYHICNGTQHEFRLYVPPKIDSAERARQAAQAGLRDIVLRGVELVKIFALTDTFYTQFVENIKILDTLTGAGQDNDKLTGELLKSIIYQIIIDNADVFNDLREARDIFPIASNVGVSGLSDDDKRSLESINDEIINTGLDDALNKKIMDFSEGLKAKQTALDEKLSNSILRTLPRNYSKEPGKLRSIDAEIFRKLDSASSSASTFKSRAAGAAVPEQKYTIFPNCIFHQQLKYVHNDITLIAKTIKLITINKSDGGDVPPAKIGLMIKYCNQISQILEGNKINKDIIDLFSGKQVLPEIDTVSSKVAELRATASTELQKIVPAFSGGGQKGGLIKPGQTKRRWHTSSRKKTKRSIKMAPKTYREQHTKLIKNLQETTVPIPFGFTAEEYADALMYRIIVKDTLLEAIRNNKTNTIPELEEVPKQLGGTLIQGTLASYCQNIYWNTIEPFLRKHFVDSGSTEAEIHKSIKCSIYAGSFLPDLFIVLEEVISSPEYSNLEDIEGQNVGVGYTSMIDTTKSAYEHIIGLLTGDTQLKVPTNSVALRSETNKEVAGSVLAPTTLQLLKVVKYNSFYEAGDLSQPRTDFFDYMKDIFLYIRFLFIIQHNETPISEESYNKLMNTIDETTDINTFFNKNKKDLNLFLKYPMIDFIDNYIEQAPSAEADKKEEVAEADTKKKEAAEEKEAEGGAVFIVGDYSKQTRRIRTHRSKKSRKNKNK